MFFFQTTLVAKLLSSSLKLASVQPSYDRKKFVVRDRSIVARRRVAMCGGGAPLRPGLHEPALSDTSNIDKRQVWQFVVNDDDFKRFL